VQRSTSRHCRCGTDPTQAFKTFQPLISNDFNLLNSSGENIVAWVNSSAKPVSWKTAHSVEEGSVKAILAAVFLVLVAAFSIREHDPPAALSAAVSPDSFSAGRAVRHLASIAEKPHPLGSAAHMAVRDYLVSQLSGAGVEPQIQQATVAVQPGPPLQMGAVENVIARLKGSGGGAKAVLLVAHYDSALNSFGASDDGAAVASLLDASRNGARLANPRLG
jgi:hypothetical protein